MSIRFRYWLLTKNSSRSCLHSSRTRRVRTLNVTMTVLLWVYEFWCTEGVRSPGWDRGHDKESRNGRDVKIDILNDYIRSSERFRVIRVFCGVPESYGNSSGSIWALLGHTGIEERGQKEGGPPSGPNWTRGATTTYNYLAKHLNATTNTIKIATKIINDPTT